MKQALKALLRSVTSRAPQGARRAMLDGCLDAMSVHEMYGDVLSRLKISEVAAPGDRGIIVSSADDTFVISEYAQTGTFAPTITEVIRSFLAPAGGTYLDIGANIGLMTVPAAREPGVHCIAFEPEPRNFDFLERNVTRNAPDASVELHQVALFHSRATLSLAIAEGNIGDHRVTINGVPGRRTVEVPAVPLDDFLDRITMPLAAKIDTQGAEPFIISGGQQVLAKAGLLVMEFCPYLMGQIGGDCEVPIALISSFQSIAVMRGGAAETPRYMQPSEAVQMLRDKVRTAQNTDADYLDIIARR